MLVPTRIIQVKLNRKTREIEVAIDDRRAASPLLAVASMNGNLSFDEQTRHAARICLTQLLPMMTESDANTLSLEDLKNLRALFAHNDEELCYALLEFCGKFGQQEELETVEKLITFVANHQLHLAAETSATAIRTRLEKAATASTLLRPTDAPSESATSLLRPAGSAAPPEEHLVRPAE